MPKQVMNIFQIQILIKSIILILITKPKKEIKMKKNFIYGLSALAVSSVMLMQIPVQAATTTTTTTYPNKVIHKTVVKPTKKVVTTDDKGSTVKNTTETKTTKTNTTQKMPAAK